MQRKASAVWQGDLKGGKGTISTDSGTLKQAQYSFSTRFENGVGTNPEELLAAAHAGCFTMALSAQLGAAGLKPGPVKASRGVVVMPDALLDDVLEQAFDMVVLPGGMPGAKTLGTDERIRKLLDRMHERRKWVVIVSWLRSGSTNAGLPLNVLMKLKM